MYIPQKLKTLLLLAALAAAAFIAYRHPYIRTLVNREAAKQGIAIDPNSPEAQILRAKGSYDDRPDEEIRNSRSARSLRAALMPFAVATDIVTLPAQAAVLRQMMRH